MSHSPPVRLDVRELSTTDTDALALKLLDEQQRNAGVKYGYCACGAAVTARTARRAAERGRAPMCKPCLNALPSNFSKDSTIYMCAVCRTVLSGSVATRARMLRKKGQAATCGKPACRTELRRQRGKAVKDAHALPCAVCGRPSTYASSWGARHRGTRPNCGGESCRRALAQSRVAAMVKPREPCAVCGRPSTYASSAYARSRRKRGADPTCLAYCEEHKFGCGQKPGRRSRRTGRVVEHSRGKDAPCDQNGTSGGGAARARARPKRGPAIATQKSHSKAGQK